MTQIARCDCLATRAGKMELSCPFGTTRLVPRQKLLWKLSNFRSRWLDIGLVLFCEFMELDSASVHKHTQKRPWPISSHFLPLARSITHIYRFLCYLVDESARWSDACFFFHLVFSSNVAALSECIVYLTSKCRKLKKLFLTALR